MSRRKADYQSSDQTHYNYHLPLSVCRDGLQRGGVHYFDVLIMFVEYMFSLHFVVK